MKSEGKPALGGVGVQWVPLFVKKIFSQYVVSKSGAIQGGEVSAGLILFHF